MPIIRWKRGAQPYVWEQNVHVPSDIFLNGQATSDQVISASSYGLRLDMGINGSSVCVLSMSAQLGGQFIGTSNGASTLTGSIRLDERLQGTSAAVCSLTGSLGAVFQGTSAGVLTTTGSLSVDIRLAGNAIVSSSTLTGQEFITAELNGLIIGSSTQNALLLRIDKSLIGSVDAVSMLMGSLDQQGIVLIHGDIIGNSFTGSINLSVSMELVGSIAANNTQLVINSHLELSCGGRSDANLITTAAEVSNINLKGLVSGETGAGSPSFFVNFALKGNMSLSNEVKGEFGPYFDENVQDIFTV